MAEYIDREALIERIRTDIAPFNVAMVFRHIHNIPAADVAPVVHGRWIKGAPNPYCSECFVECRDETPFCPHCGAKMDGGKSNGKT